MKRGEIVIVAAPGSYGKPRPAVVVQADVLIESGIQSLIVFLLTSTIVEAPLFRIPIEPNRQNGLEMSSQIMVDKIVSIPREKITRVIGMLSDDDLVKLNRTLAFVIGLG